LFIPDIHIIDKQLISDSIISMFTEKIKEAEKYFNFSSKIYTAPVVPMVAGKS